MTVQELLVTELGPLVGGRVFPNTFMQGDSLPQWPAIRYILSNISEASACGTNTTASDDVQAQIDVVARTYAEVYALKELVIAALMDTSPPCSRQLYFETYDAPTKTNRVILTYLFSLTA